LEIGNRLNYSRLPGSYFWFRIESQPAAQGEAPRTADFGEVLKEDNTCMYM